MNYAQFFFRFTIQSVKMTNDSWNHFQDKRTHFKLLSNEINQLFSFATISLNLSLSLSLSLSFKNNSNLVCEVTNNCNYRLSHHQTALIFPPVLRVWKRESIIQKKIKPITTSTAEHQQQCNKINLNKREVYIFPFECPLLGRKMDETGWVGEGMRIKVTRHK